MSPTKINVFNKFSVRYFVRVKVLLRRPVVDAAELAAAKKEEMEEDEPQMEYDESQLEAAEEEKAADEEQDDEDKTVACIVGPE